MKLRVMVSAEYEAIAKGRQTRIKEEVKEEEDPPREVSRIQKSTE